MSKDIRYDLAIVDYNLYDFEGDKFIEELRKSNLKMPVMVLASNRSRLDQVEHLNNVMTLQKPIDFKEFKPLVIKVLRLDVSKE